MVRDYLAGRAAGENGVMLLLDMDDFESINQKEGNVFADAVLQEVADLLLAEAGQEHIPIRLGGDEFMLFVKKCDRRRAGTIARGSLGWFRGFWQSRSGHADFRQHWYVQHRGGGGL